jgi:predicted Zn-dependent protease
MSHPKLIKPLSFGIDKQVGFVGRWSCFGAENKINGSNFTVRCYNTCCQEAEKEILVNLRSAARRSAVRPSFFLKAATVPVLCTAALLAAGTEPFSFTKIDIDLLEQTNLLDKRLEREGLVYHSRDLNAYVTQIGLSVVPLGLAVDRAQWQFRVLRDPMPNAFAMPNGSVYVNSGLLSLLENEDQLASVLAHEVTHVTDRHSFLHYRDYRKKAAIANISSYAARVASGSGDWGRVIGLAVSVLPVLMDASIRGYSRELERNADVYSFNKLVEGNYDPREMANTFRLLQRKDEVDLPENYYNDHPKLEERIKYLTELVQSRPPAEVAEEVRTARRTRYLDSTEAVDREDIYLALLSRRSRTALTRAQKLVDRHPDSADNLYCLAEAYRGLGPWTARPTEQELSGAGQKDNRNLKKKFTPDEQEQELLSRDGGQTAWRQNQKLSEEYYQKALAADPTHAKAYRGIGALYEKQRKHQEALAAYQKYLDLQPNALDQVRIRQRIESLQRSVGQ